QTAIYRYLLGAVRDPEMADELFQEFALRFVRGDFRRAEESRGRFRDFVKTALINLVINHRRKQARSKVFAAETPEAFAAPPEADRSDEEFVASWRQALLDTAWKALADVQRQKGPPFYDVLRLRFEQPELPAVDMARELTTRLQPVAPFT